MSPPINTDPISIYDLKDEQLARAHNRIDTLEEERRRLKHKAVAYCILAMICGIAVGCLLVGPTR